MRMFRMARVERRLEDADTEAALVAKLKPLLPGSDPRMVVLCAIRVRFNKNMGIRSRGRSASIKLAQDWIKKKPDVDKLLLKVVGQISKNFLTASAEAGAGAAL